MDGGVATQPPPQRFFHMPRLPQHQKQNFYRHHGHAQAQPGMAFDGKRMRKAVHRRTIDYNASCIRYLENRLWQRDYRDMRAIQPDNSYGTDLPLPTAMTYNTINSVTTKFVRTSTNKVRCPIFVVRWTPEGRRLVTGASSGEFTLWNGLTFNFETILQAHEYPVRTMTWSHNDMWMLTGDHAGYVKYWQSNMNNVKMFQAHKEPIREARWAVMVTTRYMSQSHDQVYLCRKLCYFIFAISTLADSIKGFFSPVIDNCHALSDNLSSMASRLPTSCNVTTYLRNIVSLQQIALHKRAVTEFRFYSDLLSL